MTTTTVFVLLMVFGGGYKSGAATLTAEFGSLKACEAARAHMMTAHNKHDLSVLAHGCFRKD